MTDGPTVALVIVFGVVVYVIAKVWIYARRSEQQWREVDKSKLKKWEDDEPN